MSAASPTPETLAAALHKNLKVKARQQQQAKPGHKEDSPLPYQPAP